MNQSPKKLREIDTILLPDTILTISSCHEYFSVGTLDDSVYIWQKISDAFRNNNFQPFDKQPVLSWNGAITGVLDIKFSPDCKKIATCSLDSVLRVWDIETRQSINIQVPVMSAWKIVYVGENLITCGELGHIQFYNASTKQSVKKIQAGQIFFTAIANSNAGNLLAVGNNNGDMYIVNLQKKDKNSKQKNAGFKPHFKTVRSLSFSEDTTKLLSSSDDRSIKIFDITSQKIISSYDGHKESVTCVRAHPIDSKIAYSCSFDKSIKIWDLRMKSCVDSFQAGSAVWAVEPVGARNLVAGGQNGALSIFSVE